MKESSFLMKFLFVALACVAMVCAPKLVFAQRGAHMRGGGFHHAGVGGLHRGAGVSGFHGGTVSSRWSHGGGHWHPGYHRHPGHWGYSGYRSGWQGGFSFGWGGGFSIGFGWVPYWYYPYPYYGYFRDNPYPYYPYCRYPLYYRAYPSPYYPSSSNPSDYVHSGGSEDDANDGGSAMPASAPSTQDSPDKSSVTGNNPASPSPVPRYADDRRTPPVAEYQLMDSKLHQLPPERRRAVQNVIAALRAMPPHARQRQIESGRFGSFSPGERELLRSTWIPAVPAQPPESYRGSGGSLASVPRPLASGPRADTGR